MEKKKARNLYEFFEALEVKVEFYRAIRKRTGLSLTMIEKWCRGDATPTKPEYLEALSEETGIAVENLFN